MIKKALTIALALFCTYSFGQTCNCETEFQHLHTFMEKNYAGFKEKEASMTKAGYRKLIQQYTKYSKWPHANEECIFILWQFLDQFKDNHVGLASTLGGKTDSAFLKQRQTIEISDEKYKQLLKSKGKEGIYYFKWDSLAYKIAVIKDKSPVHDYIGVIVSSNLPGWKKGSVKLYAKMKNDSAAQGVLFMRNQMPAVNGFTFRGDEILGDFQRVGTTIKKEQEFDGYEPFTSKKLDNKTLYIKLTSFSPGYKKKIDSLFKANEGALKTMPNLVLDLRGNNGGTDAAYQPILPYIYSNPVKNIGNDLYATEANIEGWKRNATNPDLSADEKKWYEGAIAQMEAHKGQWINWSDDGTYSNFKRLPNPSKVVVLIDNSCASSAEEFLFEARQSSKVILLGQNTSGTLDYSNWVPTPLVCYPYVLRYPTTRSRRIDLGQGIDNIGIKPNRYLNPKEDWIKAAVQELEK
jgi:hypothetical protein